MGTKLQELESTTGCFAKAANDEPIFVLRAKDALAPLLVRMWVELAQFHAVDLEEMEPKLDEALDLANAMVEWQTAHAGEIKFPD